MSDMERIARLLGLRAHREGGWFREHFRSGQEIELPRGTRAAASSIYLLMPPGSLSALHTMKSDEIWHHYDGGPVDLHLFDAAGVYRVERLGRDLDAGERPQIVVPAGVLQAAVPAGARYSLCCCTVVPGFHPGDVETPSRAALIERFPAHADRITSLTTEGAGR